MVDPIQVAYKMEDETKKKALMRDLVWSNIRSQRKIVDDAWEKCVDKSQGNSYPPKQMFVLILLHHREAVFQILD